jgi:hypothetical protein
VGKIKSKEIDLGKSGTFTLHLSDDARRLLIEFDVDERGFTKSDLNLFISNLKEIREEMSR